MVAITDYNTLKQAVKEVTEDDGTEFDLYLPNAINLAEERLYKELDLPDLLLKQQAALTANVSTLTKPSGYDLAEYLVVGLASSRRVLKKKTESWIKDYWPDQTITGLPKYYADASATTFILAPTPEQEYNYELKYLAKPTKLSNSNQTNYYLNNCKDALFNATVLEMVIFMKAFSQVDLWQNRFNQSRDTWNIEMQRKRRDGGVTPNSRDGMPNTLLHTVQTNA